MQQKFSNLFRPPTLCPAPLFGLGTPTNSTTLTTEWHTLLFLKWHPEDTWRLLKYAWLRWPGQFHEWSESEHEDVNFLICMTLWDFLCQVYSKPLSEVTSGHLREELLPLFKAEQYSIIHYTLFIHSFVDGHLGYFHLYVTVNNATVNVSTHNYYMLCVGTHFQFSWE